MYYNAYEFLIKITQRRYITVPGRTLSRNGEGKFNENIAIYVPDPEYLLAMKSISMRIGIESSDLEDIKFLIKHLKITKLEDIFNLIKKYYSREQIPLKTYYALEEIFQDILDNNPID